MNYGKCIIIIMAMLIGVVCPVFAVNVSIDADRMLLVDGARTFIIGLYENPDDDEVLKEVADAGFNLVRASADMAALDRLHRNNLYGWINVGGRIELDPDTPESAKGLVEVVTTYGNHPALLVWEGPDESLWMCALRAFKQGGTLEEMASRFKGDTEALQKRLLAGYRKMKQIDPEHPVWLNHAAGNSQEQLAGYGEAADIVGADIYPLMPYPTKPLDISRRGLGFVGLCTTKMQGSAPGKPVWMVLQGMSWGAFENDVFTLKPQPGQWPTFEESRFMAYDAIARGSRGILYWGTHIMGKDTECWEGIVEVVKELKDNQFLLSTHDAEVRPSVETRIFGLLPFEQRNSTLGVQVLGKQVGEDTWWIVVNELFLPVTYSLSGLNAYDGLTYMETKTGTNAIVKSGCLSLPISAYGVHILKPDGI